MLGTRIISTGLTFLFLLTLFFAALPHTVTADDSILPDFGHYVGGGVVIGQVQPGRAPNATEEYIEIYNNTNEDIDVTNWCLEYSSASGATTTRLGCLTPPQANWHLFLPAGQYALAVSTVFLHGQSADFAYDLVFTAGMNDTGGHVRIVDAAKAEIDRIGWGTATMAEGAAAPRPDAGTALSRVAMAVDSVMLQDTNNNAHDFELRHEGALNVYQQLREVFDVCGNLDDVQTTVPFGFEQDQDGLCYDPTITPGPIDTTPTFSCEGVVISEALPNPAGVDADKEFIELHNPTNDYIDLYGCALRLGSGNARYVFTESIELEPGQYAAFYDSVTGITLPNAAGGTISLVTAAGVETSVSYPANMADDTVWMQHDGVWQVSYAPSPNALNIVLPLKPCDAGQVRNEATGRCIAVAAALAELADCGEGRERNPETNRCRNIVIATTALADCGEGRERNPETNRCRNIASSTSALADCGEGRERNPETNRCRNVASASTALADCGEGRERNPETNRCRNIVASSSGIPTVRDVATGERADMTGWWVAGGVLLLAAGYGIYEWRKDIMRWITQRLPLRRR